MGAVVCAVRGGPHSQPTIQRAIHLARTLEQPLTFVYVVNLDFLAYTSSSGTPTLLDDLKNMGEFILLMAQAQAAKEGVQAEGIIIEGHLRDELVKLCRQIQADYLVLGRPKQQPTENAFSQDAFLDFVAQIEKEAQVKVVLADETD